MNKPPDPTRPASPVPPTLQARPSTASSSTRKYLKRVCVASLSAIALGGSGLALALELLPPALQRLRPLAAALLAFAVVAFVVVIDSLKQLILLKHAKQDAPVEKL